MPFRTLIRTRSRRFSSPQRRRKSRVPRILMIRAKNAKSVTFRLATFVRFSFILSKQNWIAKKLQSAKQSNANQLEIPSLEAPRICIAKRHTQSKELKSRKQKLKVFKAKTAQKRVNTNYRQAKTARDLKTQKDKKTQKDSQKNIKKFKNIKSKKLSFFAACFEFFCFVFKLNWDSLCALCVVKIDFRCACDSESDFLCASLQTSERRAQLISQLCKSANQLRKSREWKMALARQERAKTGRKAQACDSSSSLQLISEVRCNKRSPINQSAIIASEAQKQWLKATHFYLFLFATCKARNSFLP